jgi:hypothetical protein
MITLIIILTIYFISVYHSLKFTKYLFRLHDMDVEISDIIGCFIPIVNIGVMLIYLVIKNYNK